MFGEDGKDGEDGHEGRDTAARIEIEPIEGETVKRRPYRIDVEMLRQCIFQI